VEEVAPARRRLVVGISGATGVVYGVRLLQRLRDVDDVETHLVMTRHAELTLKLEGPCEADEVRELADVVHGVGEIGAPIASGSYLTDGMVIAPCSIKTLSGVANSFADNLLIRAADVTLKERRPLVLMVRETPLHLGHLRLMAAAAEAGATIFPPVPAFYARPASIDELVDHTVSRVLDRFGIDAGPFRRWEGTRERVRRDRDA
jgi:4-hydroxy-3-polyprenylbenzoate decarboxylase